MINLTVKQIDYLLDRLTEDKINLKHRDAIDALENRDINESIEEAI